MRARTFYSAFILACTACMMGCGNAPKTVESAPASVVPAVAKAPKAKPTPATAPKGDRARADANEKAKAIALAEVEATLNKQKMEKNAAEETAKQNTRTVAERIKRDDSAAVAYGLLEPRERRELLEAGERLRSVGLSQITNDEYSILLKNPVTATMLRDAVMADSEYQIFATSIGLGKEKEALNRACADSFMRALASARRALSQAVERLKEVGLDMLVPEQKTLLASNPGTAALLAEAARKVK
jgi:hypothetical protein